jgi:hypothetical protein
MIDDPELYELVKQYADLVYKKPSAYKSGYIVRLYKQLGGTYTEDFKPKKLKTWFKERWADIGEKDYPVYRPTIRVNKDTPLTIQEIDPQNLKEQIALKQQIKGKRNLPDFRRKSV